MRSHLLRVSARAVAAAASILSFCLICIPVQAQECDQSEVKTDTLTHGIIISPVANTLGHLSSTLQKCPLWQARSIYFGETYTSRLVDWVVYIPPDTTDGRRIRESLTRNNQDLNPLRPLRAEKDVYVLVFWERRVATPTATALLLRAIHSYVSDSAYFARTSGFLVRQLRDGPFLSREAVSGRMDPPDSLVKSLLDSMPDTTDQRRLAYFRSHAFPKDSPTQLALIARRNVIRFQRDPILSRLVTSFSELLLTANVSPPAATPLADSTVQLVFDSLGTFRPAGDKTDSINVIYVATAKFPVNDQMWGRLNIFTTKDVRPLGTRTILRNFVTTSPSPFSLSVASGMVIDVKSISNGIERRHTDVNLFAMVHYGFSVRPKPLRHAALYIAERSPLFWFESFSVFGGTNLRQGSVFDQFVGGLALDGIWGSDLSLTAGVARVKDAGSRLHPFVAIALHVL